MRLMSFSRADGSKSWGIVEGDAVVDCGELASDLRAALGAAKMLEAPREARRRALQ